VPNQIRTSRCESTAGDALNIETIGTGILMSLHPPNRILDAIRFGGICPGDEERSPSSRCQVSGSDRREIHASRTVFRVDKGACGCVVEY
jgi:hypothetical protein